MTPPPRLVCIPRGAVAFAADARDIAARLPPELADREALAWFAAELRRIYPTAIVRPQTDLARAEWSEMVWYATLPDRDFRIDFAIRVPVPPATAFEIYVHRVTEWQAAVRLRPRRVTPELVGTEYEATYSFLGQRFQGVFRVLAVNPPRSISLEAEGSGITVSYTTTFQPDGPGTLVRVRGDYALPDSLLAGVADRLGLERAISRDIQRANDAYRRLCESTGDRTE